MEEEIKILENITVVLDFPKLKTTFEIDGSDLKKAIIARYKKQCYTKGEINYILENTLNSHEDLCEHIAIFLEWDLLKDYLTCTRENKKRGDYKINRANIFIKE